MIKIERKNWFETLDKNTRSFCETHKADETQLQAIVTKLTKLNERKDLTMLEKKILVSLIEHVTTITKNQTTTNVVETLASHPDCLHILFGKFNTNGGFQKIEPIGNKAKYTLLKQDDFYIKYGDFYITQIKIKPEIIQNNLLGEVHLYKIAEGYIAILVFLDYLGDVQNRVVLSSYTLLVPFTLKEIGRKIKDNPHIMVELMHKVFPRTTPYTQNVDYTAQKGVFQRFPSLASEMKYNNIYIQKIHT
jgi:hypothetical protein